MKESVSPKARVINSFAKSSGQEAINEDQVPLGFNWKNSKDKKKNVMSMQDGYAVDFMASPTSIEDDVTLDDDKNYSTVGPVTIATGVTVTIADGSTWTIV